MAVFYPGKTAVAYAGKYAKLQFKSIGENTHVMVRWFSYLWRMTGFKKTGTEARKRMKM